MERPASPQERRRSWFRISTTYRLSFESRFLDQRNEEAHRYFLRVLDRVCADAETEEWPEPLAELPHTPYKPRAPWSRP